ncbi:MAG: phytanoyl-CoA dioxygenase family protein [Pseudomonadota bacterium]
MTSPSLTAEERRRYDELGYVIPAYRLSTARLDELRGAVDRAIANNPTVRPEQLASIHTQPANDSDTIGDDVFLTMALDAELVALVSGVLGPDIAMWGVQVFCKPGGGGMEVPMHQDGQYWPIRPLATCTVWIALDDVDKGNGCMSVVPGSHRPPVAYAHKTETAADLVLNQSIEDPRVPVREPHFLELEAGQMSLHDVYLVHGSAPNRSGRRRAGLAIRYMPTTSRFRRDIDIPFAGYPVDWAGKPIWLVRGRDVSGNNDSPDRALGQAAVWTRPLTPGGSGAPPSIQTASGVANGDLVTRESVHGDCISSLDSLTLYYNV